MPKSEELATEFKSLQELAMKIDENPDLANEPVEAKPALESRPEPAIQEGEKESSEEVQETEPVEAADTAEIEPEQIAPTDSEKGRKDKERWTGNSQVRQEGNQEAKRVKAEADAKVRKADERARKAEEEAAKLRAKPAEVPHKDKRGYTVEDYESFANTQEEEGNWQQARNARQEAAALRQEAYNAEWHANRLKTIEENSELRNMDSPLTKEADRLLAEPDNPYFTRVTGFKYAVAQAK